MEAMDHRIGRRQLLAAGGAAATAVMVASCSGNAEQSTQPGKAKPPTYVPFPDSGADIPGNDKGIPDAFFSYPAEPKSFVEGPVGSGGQITVFGPTNGLGAPKDRSEWWKNVDKTLNIDLKLNVVPGGQLLSKQQVLLASGDIPDIMIINPNTLPAAALQKNFADLSQYLSADAVKDYPALAALPSISWRTPTINGSIYGVPQPRISAGYALAARFDVLEQKGIAATVSDGAEFLNLLRELTDARSNKWAIGQDPMWMLRIVLEMLGFPNGANAWRESNGRFSSMFESEEMVQALEIVSAIVRDGLMHPDSTAKPNAAWFPGGTTSLSINDFTQFTSLAIANPDIEIGLIPLPKWDGGGLAVKQLNAGASGAYAAFRKAEPDRIRELLRVANYIAAPFGTKEYLSINFGVEGVSYTLDGSDPVLTEAGKADSYSRQALAYVTSRTLDVLYVPKNRELVQRQYDYLTAVMRDTYFNPTIGLYSETNVGAGVAAAKVIQDAINDILSGRKQLSTWSEAVSTWRTQAGDKMRAEYEDAFARN